MVGVAFSVFARHSVHCFLLLVNCRLCSYKQCPEEAYLYRWAKRQLNNKNNRQKNEIICLKNTVARLKSKDLPPKKLLGWQRHFFVAYILFIVHPISVSKCCKM